MSDFLVQLSKNPQARNLIKTLGLPVPMPQELDRPKGPSVARPLEGKSVAFFSVGRGAVATEIFDSRCRDRRSLRYRSVGSEVREVG